MNCIRIAVWAFALGALPGVALAQQDPPTLAGRIATVSGAVTFLANSSDQGSAAVVNYPLTSGNQLVTAAQAGVGFDIGADRLLLDQSGALAIDNLDQNGVTLDLSQGAVFVDHRAGDPDVAIHVARGDVHLSAPGQYEIVSGDQNQPTWLSVISGQGEVDAGGIALRPGAGQTAELDGSASVSGQILPLEHDAFLDQALAADQVAAAPVAMAPEMADMTGVEQLYGVGSWEESADDGWVWYPPVDADWSPYSEGYWGWVAPWGWTWVDYEPWGFAPFHYGRWSRNGGRWCWVPGGGGDQGRPAVYAPALVAFTGTRSSSLGGGRPTGWVPLGPREAYTPPYRHSAAYGAQFQRPDYAAARSSEQLVNRGAAVGGSNESFVDRRQPAATPRADRGAPEREPLAQFRAVEPALPAARPEVAEPGSYSAPRAEEQFQPRPQYQPAPQHYEPAPAFSQPARPAPEQRPSEPATSAGQGRRYPY